MWFIYALLSAICAGGVAVLSKMSSKAMNVYVVTAIKMFFMSLSVVGIAFVMKKFEITSLYTLDYNDWFGIIFSGFLGGLGALFYFLGLSSGDAAHVVAIERLGIIFVIAFAYLFLGEGISLLKALGGLCMIGGGYLIVYY